MMWSYEFTGTLPKYEPPEKISKLDNKSNVTYTKLSKSTKNFM